jgi:hypothetical protein
MEIKRTIKRKERKWKVLPKKQRERENENEREEHMKFVIKWVTRQKRKG